MKHYIYNLLLILAITFAACTDGGSGFGGFDDDEYGTLMINNTDCEIISANCAFIGPQYVDGEYQIPRHAEFAITCIYDRIVTFGVQLDYVSSHDELTVGEDLVRRNTEEEDALYIESFRGVVEGFSSDFYNIQGQLIVKSIDKKHVTLEYKNFRFTELTSNQRELHYTVNGTVRFTDINAN